MPVVPFISRPSATVAPPPPDPVYIAMAAALTKSDATKPQVSPNGK